MGVMIDRIMQKTGRIVLALLLSVLIVISVTLALNVFGIVDAEVVSQCIQDCIGCSNCNQ